MTLEEVWREIVRILRSGDTIELKLVGGEIQVVAIRRKLKIKLPPITG